MTLARATAVAAFVFLVQPACADDIDDMYNTVKLLQSVHAFGTPAEVGLFTIIAEDCPGWLVTPVGLQKFNSDMASAKAMGWLHDAMADLEGVRKQITDRTTACRQIASWLNGGRGSLPGI